MSNAVTDTHALIWYLEDSPRLGAAANRVFNECDRGEIVIYTIYNNCCNSILLSLSVVQLVANGASL